MKPTGIRTRIILSSFILGAGIIILGSETVNAENLVRVPRQDTTTTTTTVAPAPGAVTPTTTTTTTTTTTETPNLNCGCSATLYGQIQPASCQPPNNTVVNSCRQGICTFAPQVLGVPYKLELIEYNCGSLGPQCAQGITGRCSFRFQIGFLPPVTLPGTCQSLQGNSRVCGCAYLQSDLAIFGSLSSNQPVFQTPCARQ